MDDFIDGILTFIGTATMTEGEYASIQLESYGYDQETYEAIQAMLAARDGISTVLLDRLAAYFTAKGVDITAPQASGTSNIFVGGSLCD